MKLLIHESQLKKFKLCARKAYPRETYGIMLGKKINSDSYIITKIIVPPLEEATYDYVIPDYPEIDVIVSEQKQNNLVYIGSIHSHPHADAIVSTHDYNEWDPKKDNVIGILSIRKRTVYRVTNLRFWQKKSSLPVKFKKVKKKGA